MTPQRVSIVLPTLNGAATLPALLDAVWRQRVGLPIETIAIDSGSTDGTLDLLRPKVDHLITIPPHTFDHGLTRNLGIMQARGDLVVLMVQDAIPASDHWLEALTAPLLKDSGLAGTFARQQPRPDASGTTRHYLARWVASGDTGRTESFASPAEFDALKPMERLLRCTFDNVCSCIRRSVWMKHPFRASPIAEDLQWARDVLLSGHRLAFVPEAVVVHSHDRSARDEFTRTRLLHRRLFELFEVETIPTLPLLVRSIASSIGVHLGCEWASPFRLPRALGLAVAWPLGQYLGARDGRKAERQRQRPDGY